MCAVVPTVGAWVLDVVVAKTGGGGGKHLFLKN